MADDADLAFAQQVVVEYARTLERDLTENRRPARIDSLPFGKAAILTDYHINESPLLEQPHFKHLNDDNPTYFRAGDQPKVAQLIDWLIEKQQSGYGMLNSVQRLAEMKQFVRGAHNEPWNCRAGVDTVIVRVDGTLAPCFPMYSATHDWGAVGAPKFDTDQLKTMKATCEPNCYSTLNHIVGWCYNDARVLRWVLKQARHGFQGVRGNLE